MTRPPHPHHHSNNDPDDAKRRAEADRDYTEFGYQELGQADALDRFLDGEIDRNSAAFRSAFVKRDFRDRVAATEEMLADLRRPLKAPDFTGSILDAVDARKPFVAKQTRRFVTVGRLAAAAAVLIVTGVGVLVQQARPDFLGFSHEPTPIAGMVEASIRTKLDPVPSAHSEAWTGAEGRGILRWGLSHVGTVRAFEVRSAASNFGAGGNGWGTIEVAHETPWRRRDQTRESSTGFATFPVPDSPERVWYASGR